MPSPLLDNMKLDLTVRTSPSLVVQTSMAENLKLAPHGCFEIRQLVGMGHLFAKRFASASL